MTFEIGREEASAELAEIRETYTAQEAVAKTGGWDAPEMDAYDAYDEQYPAMKGPRQTL